MVDYTIALARNFSARHSFPQKEGTEGLPHPHEYRLEIQLRGDKLDQNGYLVDLDEIDRLLREVLVRYTDVFLNDLPEFSDIPPSLENFSRLLCRAVSGGLKAPQVEAVTLKLWENEWAWASFHEERE